MGLASSSRSGATTATTVVIASATAGAVHIRRATSHTDACRLSARSAVTHSSKCRRVTNSRTSARAIASSITTLWCARMTIENTA